MQQIALSRQQQSVIERLQAYDKTPINSQLWKAEVHRRKAAVLIGLRPHPSTDDMDLLLTVRADNLRAYPGDVAFPGGKEDPQKDKNAINTALREASEEVGLESKDVKVICQLEPILSRTMILVFPVVVLLPSTFEAVPSPDEVRECFYIPLHHFIQPHPSLAYRQYEIEWGATQRPYRIHEFRWENEQIWGITANYLIHAASIAYDELPKFNFDFDMYRYKTKEEKVTARFHSKM